MVEKQGSRDIMSNSPVTHQQRIDKHFDASAQHWKDLYQDRSLEGVIHQHRRSVALRWIEGLALSTPVRVLEVGCGAGLVAMDLARHGYDVDCIDTSKEMVALAMAEAQDAAVAGGLTIDVGDVHALSFDSSAFDLVIALGVVPFLHSPEKALVEMGRVCRRGSWVLLSSDNKFRLNRLLDPRFVPFPGREWFKDVLSAIGVKGEPEVPVNFFSHRVITKMLARAGFHVERCVTIGFGPFRFLGKDFVADPRAITLNTWLQERADRGVPALRSVGAQHLILARKV